jgi:hypothetical protein
MLLTMKKNCFEEPLRNPRAVGANSAIPKATEEGKEAVVRARSKNTFSSY